jgi:hypothetical protein
MLSPLLGLAWLGLGAFWGYPLHHAVYRAWGRRRVGRLAAYVIGAVCYCVGVYGLLMLLDGGWMRGRGLQSSWYRVTWPEALATGAAAGLLFGAAFFLKAEWAGGGPFDLRSSAGGPEFPPDYVADVLRLERSASAAENRRFARWLVKRAHKVREPLPAELQAFAARHLPPRLTRR